MNADEAQEEVELAISPLDEPPKPLGIDPDFTPGTFESFSDDIKQYLQRRHPLQLAVIRPLTTESD